MIIPAFVNEQDNNNLMQSSSYPKDNMRNKKVNDVAINVNQYEQK